MSKYFVKLKGSTYRLTAKGVLEVLRLNGFAVQVEQNKTGVCIGVENESKCLHFEKSYNEIEIEAKTIIKNNIAFALYRERLLSVFFLRKCFASMVKDGTIKMPENFLL